MIKIVFDKLIKKVLKTNQKHKGDQGKIVVKIHLRLKLFIEKL
jgi:hypothetical protein